MRSSLASLSQRLQHFLGSRFTPLVTHRHTLLRLRQVFQDVVTRLQRQDPEPTFVLMSWPDTWVFDLQSLPPLVQQVDQLVLLTTAEWTDSDLPEDQRGKIQVVKTDPTAPLRKEWIWIVLNPHIALMAVAHPTGSAHTWATSWTLDREFIRDSIAWLAPGFAVNQRNDCTPESITLGMSALLAELVQSLDPLLSGNRDQDPSLGFINEFIGSVSRELRTPLTNIKTAVRLLQSSQIKPTQRAHYLNLISFECERQNRLINSLLELTEPDDQEGAKTLILADFLPGIVSTYQPLAQEKGIMLAYTVPTGLNAVLFPGGALKKIVVQLISNALKFTPQGGQVWVTCKEQNGLMCLDVRDTGIGIPATEFTKIFERFYRIPHPEASGVGLGLTIVQQLVQRFGGRVAVRSQLNHGSTFTILLPLASSPETVAL